MLVRGMTPQVAFSEAVPVRWAHAALRDVVGAPVTRLPPPGPLVSLCAQCQLFSAVALEGCLEGHCPGPADSTHLGSWSLLLWPAETPWRSV